MGMVKVIAMKVDTFPLSKSTDILGVSDSKEGETELIITSPNPKGCVIYAIGTGKIELNIDGMDCMLLEVTVAGEEPKAGKTEE